MSRSDAAYFASAASRVQDGFARNADFGRGRGYAWMAYPDAIDLAALPKPVTAIRRNDPPARAPAARSNGKAAPTGERAPQIVRRPAPVVAVQPVVVEQEAPVSVESVPDATAELDAARVLLLATLRTRQAVLEREEAVEAERIRVEAEAEQIRRDDVAARLREEQERLAREAVLREERSRLIEAFRVVDMEVFALLWPGKSFTRERIVSWVRVLDIEDVRGLQRRLSDMIAQHTAAKAESVRREAEAKANAEKLNPKKKGFSILDHLRVKAADPVVPVRPPPSKGELAERERQINGQRKKEIVIEYAEDLKRSLRDRIEALDPEVIARLHSQKPVVYFRVGWPVRLEPVVHTWPSIDRLLNALKGAKAKIDGKVVDNGAMIGRIKVFVAWCEQG